MLLVLCVAVASTAVQAQTKQLMQWQNDLKFLRNATGDELMENRAAVVQIRNGVEFWLKLHPDSRIELAPAADQPWGTEEIRNQVSVLLQAVETIIKEESGRPFDLGVTAVSVTAEASPLSAVADSFGRDEIINRQAVNAATALDYIPGVAIDHATSGRNEASIMIRGFSSRGQVPLYLDGIPVSMPYDGTIDFNRILSSDIAEVQVAKGFSSPLLGPNGMGGSINLVTRQPEKKLQAEAVMGTGSGDTLLSSLNLGSRWENFYIQGSIDWLQNDFFPLSGNFTPARYQPDQERRNSDMRDGKYSGRIAWTPDSDQYVFSYRNQKGEKGIPLYAGPNADVNPGRFGFRRWPYWNNNGYALMTDTALGNASSIKFRAYYDQFNNEMSFYDDDTFSTMNRSHTNSSRYDDHSAGGSAEFTTRRLARNLLSGSLSFRDDTHKKTEYYPSQSFLTATEQQRVQTWSIGVQDVITLTERLRATVGFSADYMKGIRVEQWTEEKTDVMPIICPSNPDNQSFSGCTADVWTYNPQGSISYTISSRDNVFFTISDRGRFPLLNESYSYSLGRGLPNPELGPENNTTLNVGYSHAFAARTVAQVEYFYNRLRNAIESVPVWDRGNVLCPDNAEDSVLFDHCTQNVNIAKKVYQGVEISIRSTPHSRLTADVSYSYINRTAVYDTNVPDVDLSLTSELEFKTYPKNKVIVNATLRLPREVLAIANYRYEGGIVLRDTTWRDAEALLQGRHLPFSSSHHTVDLGTVFPIHSGFSVQAGIKNLFDRHYYYTAGYPEPGRNWFFNARYRF